MNVIDTSQSFSAVFHPISRKFDLERWEAYMDKALPKIKPLCLEDRERNLAAGNSWETDCLPVLNAVATCPEKIEKAVCAFHSVTDGLDEKIRRIFKKTVTADVIFYLGLCNGAGWVTSVGDQTVILLGAEKIIELGWEDADSMNGLLLHELGHVYQAQYGVLKRDTLPTEKAFLWQLFTEGVAMVFEQKTVGDLDYFHQDHNGWKAWCDEHIGLLAQAFRNDLKTMNRKTQRYFGDRVTFQDHADTGYYLGARFVQFLLKQETFDEIIGYDIPQVQAGFDTFLHTLSASV